LYNNIPSSYMSSTDADADAGICKPIAHLRNHILKITEANSLESLMEWTSTAHTPPSAACKSATAGGRRKGSKGGGGGAQQQQQQQQQQQTSTFIQSQNRAALDELLASVPDLEAYEVQRVTQVMAAAEALQMAVRRFPSDPKPSKRICQPC
jgi:hypothetical protein